MSETFDLSTAAEICGVSRTTIRRKLDQGAFPNAYRSGPTSTSSWLIPLDDLRAAGYRPTYPTVLDAATQTGHAGDEHVAYLQKRLAVAEAIATERAALIDVLRHELRALHDSLRQAIGPITHSRRASPGDH